MPPTQADDIFTLGSDVLGTAQDGQGTITAQMGDVVAQDVTSDDAEVWGPTGLISRPAKAEPGKRSSQAITINGGSNDVAVAFRDLRLNITLADGETAIYAAGADGKGATRILLQDGSITITTGGAVTVNGASVSLAGGADYVALAAKVDAQFNAVAATINSFVNVPAAGPGVTGGTASFVKSFSPQSVAASKVKAT